MAPVDRIDHDGIERTQSPLRFTYSGKKTQLKNPTEQLKDVIQDFYRIMVQVSTYDSMGRPSKDVLSNEV